MAMHGRPMSWVLQETCKPWQQQHTSQRSRMVMCRPTYRNVGAPAAAVHRLAPCMHCSPWCNMLNAPGVSRAPAGPEGQPLHQQAADWQDTDQGPGHGWQGAQQQYPPAAESMLPNCHMAFTLAEASAAYPLPLEERVSSCARIGQQHTPTAHHAALVKPLLCPAYVCCNMSLVLPFKG